MASGITRGRVRTATTTKSRNIALGHTPAKRLTLQLWNYPCYGHIDTYQNKASAVSITWPYLRFRFRAHQDHVFSSWSLPRYWFRLDCRLKPGYRNTVTVERFEKFSLSISILLFVIRVPLWFIIISLVFFYLCKVLFSGFLQFNGNFVNGQNNSKYRDCAPFTYCNQELRFWS